jgi:RHS repeat-associated protein
MLTGVDGKLTERYSYSVTGAVTITDARGSEIPSSAVGNRWFFTGREWLSGVGLYDYRNRVYSSELGRFMQTDPIKFYAGDINIYRYVGNNYVNINDPDGLDWFHDPSDPNYDLGRPDSLIPEGGAVSRFLENYVPGMSTFADNHDALVDAMHADGIPDFLCNIPTMPFMYALSIWEEAVNSVVDFFTWLFE